jgi:hypothetical protein
MLVDVASGAARDLLHGRWAEWSPDGRSVAYADPAQNLGVAASDGSGARVLGPGDDFDWSPDGRSLVVTHGGDLFVVDVATGIRRTLVASPQTELGPAWSPDGALVAFLRGSDYYVVDPAGGEPRLLARGLAIDLDVPVDRDDPWALGPVWSPDGLRLALPLARVAIVERDGTLARALRRRPPGPNWSGEWDPAWAPDGRRLAFTVISPCRGLERHSLMAVGLDGRNSRLLTNRCRIVGSARSERLVGTTAGEFVYGLGGDDRISAGWGPDAVYAGPGDDRADAGATGDFCDADGVWCDAVWGGPGDDALTAPLHGSRGAALDGGEGRDRLLGGGGGDDLEGGPGRDVLSGSAGDDVLRARDGARDVVRCGRGRDVAVVDRLDAVAGDCETVRRAR